MINDYTPTVAELKVAWQKWSAWKRIPTVGAERSGEEFDRAIAALIEKEEQ